MLDDHLIDVAPAPILARLERLDDRMAAGVEVFSGVPVFGLIAAAHMAALQAEAQMHPRITCLQAIFAALRAGRDLADRIEMRTHGFHRDVLLENLACSRRGLAPSSSIILNRSASF